VTSGGRPGVQADFPGFDPAVRQIQDARVLGGIHFRFATVTAARMGDAVAADVIERDAPAVPGEDQPDLRRQSAARSTS
jgi:hypothetical protein